MQRSYVKIFASPLVSAVFMFRVGHFICVVGKCFDMLTAAVGLMTERKGIRKVTAGEYNDLDIKVIA
jgi:hypothetical protein